MTNHTCIHVGSILVMAACAARSQPVEPPALQARGVGAVPDTGSEDRGLRVESAPFTLQIGLLVHGSTDGPLRDGSTIASGDRIQVFARTTEDAHLYLAYCTANRDLTVFPDYGSIVTPAGALTVAPGNEAALLVDDHLGTEALYVILSRTDLASADPRLAAAIKNSRLGDPAANCNAGFQTAVARPATRGAPATSRAGEGAHARRSRGAMRPDDDEPPVVTIERGMYVNQNGLGEVTTRTDANGIAILHYRFQHVAAPRR